MQFENLDKKFAILIECKVQIISSNVMIRDSDLDQIDLLFDWLNFAGCRIPIAIYSKIGINKTLRMSIASMYWEVKFLNTKSDINDFFDIEKDKNSDKKEINFNISSQQQQNNMLNNQISKSSRFTIFSLNFDKNFERFEQPKVSDKTSNIPHDFLKIVESSNSKGRKLSFIEPARSLIKPPPINDRFNYKKRNTLNAKKASTNLNIHNSSISEETSKEELLGGSDSNNSGK
jgi:hypothetical protein